jgi:hypothetical protein
MACGSMVLYLVVWYFFLAGQKYQTTGENACGA